MHDKYGNPIPLWVFILVPIILLAQSLWLFTDAKRRNKNRWFWGIVGLIQAPSPLIIYCWLYIYRPWKKKKASKKS